MTTTAPPPAATALDAVTAADELGYWPGYDQGAVPLELPGWFTREAAL
jgi:hypothetical protein